MPFEIKKVGKKWRITGTCVCENIKGHNNLIIEVSPNAYARKWEAEAMLERWTRCEKENIELNAKALAQRHAAVARYLAIRADRAKQIELAF